MKRIVVLASLAGILSVALVQIMAEEKPERAGSPAERGELRVAPPIGKVIDEGTDAAVAESGEGPADEDASPPAAGQAAPPADPAALQKQIEELRAELAATKKELGLLKDEVGRLAQIATEDSQTLRDLLKHVAEKDGEEWKIRVNALSDKGAALQGGAGRAGQGRLLIDNSGDERLLYVNGTPWRAIKGKSFIWVPVGPCAIATEGGVEPEVHDTWKRNPDTGVMEMSFVF